MCIYACVGITVTAASIMSRTLGHRGGGRLLLIAADGNILSCNSMSKGSGSVEKPGPAEVCSLTNNSSFRADPNTAVPLRPVIVRLLQLGNILRKNGVQENQRWS